MKHTRRSFLKSTAGSAVAVGVLPNVITSFSLFGADAPSKRIQVAQIGCGRMGREDVQGVMAHSLARVVAVCDLDSKRLAAGKKLVEEHYAGKGESKVEAKTFSDFHDVLASKEIDAVVVSVPDHWHALVATSAALAGKNIYVQKPITYNIAESIALRKAVRARKVILQTGSQQRSEHPFPAFRPASEAVRNGRIGKLKTIKIGIGLDKPSGKKPAPMTVPENLNFDRWLGAAPEQPYMEGRVHPQDSLSGRPGWITTEDFGLGMITNWGAHHIDIAQWAMGLQLSGPQTIEARADFMQDDVWTVHRTYHVEMQYPGDIQVILDNNFDMGIRFEGEDGWIFCTRGSAKVTKSDGSSGKTDEPSKKALMASDEKILSKLDSKAVRWMPSKDHYLNWLEAIAANRDPIAPVDQAARSLQTCAAAWIGMKLQRKLTWDAAKEEFVNDGEANALRSRKPRKPEYDVQSLLKNAGVV
ncbi:MAG: Gfo/Idh/MocA family oxidoreductase [Verrucomicrobia bacterium]|nr:MAG: Gfo/Idh/MocA family oxidoreductase [Verrucomicrobiota bacterium]